MALVVISVMRVIHASPPRRASDNAEDHRDFEGERPCAMQFRCLIIRCPLQRMAMEEEPGIVSPVISCPTALCIRFGGWSLAVCGIVPRTGGSPDQNDWRGASRTAIVTFFLISQGPKSGRYQEASQNSRTAIQIARIVIQSSKIALQSRAP